MRKKKCDSLAHILKFAKNHFTRGLTNVFDKSNTDGVFRLFVQDYKSFFDGSQRYKA